MFSKKGAKLLEESAEKRTYGSTSNSGPSTETKRKSKTENPELTSSAPPVLEPSKDASRPSKPQNRVALDGSASPPINPWRTLVTRSCPEPSSIVPISSDDQTNDHTDEQQIINLQEMDGHLTTCSNLIYGYKNAAIALRSSIFIHIFQVLFSLIPISAMVMGVIFDGKCDEYELLPAYGGLTGFIGIVFIGFWMSVSCYNRLGRSSSDIHKLLFAVIFVMFSISVIIEVSVFGTMSCSFDQHAPNYCNKTFYYYAFYKHIATGATAVVSMILYLPGSLHYLCCH